MGSYSALKNERPLSTFGMIYPGGSQQLGEELKETLTREVMEETGFTVRSYPKENASPLVLKVKSELLEFPELDKTSYMNWKVNDEKPTCS